MDRSPHCCKTAKASKTWRRCDACSSSPASSSPRSRHSPGYELTDEATPNGLHFHTTRQPLFHKDYDGLAAQIRSWRADGYTIYICAASREGHERARDILTPRLSEAELPTEVTLGLHEGFVDEDHRWVLLTEHELFDRYHKYTLRSDKASSGKVTLSLKEIQSFSRATSSSTLTTVSGASTAW